MNSIITRKIKMLSCYKEGFFVALTLLLVEENIVVKKHFYNEKEFVTIASCTIKKNHLNRRLKNIFKLNNYFKFYTTFLNLEKRVFKIGDKVLLPLKGQRVNAVGITKGKGFAGVMKRWNFKGGPATMGATKWHRRPGSIGTSQNPSRVLKGKKMPGRMGGIQRTVLNLKIIDIFLKENRQYIYVSGSVPGIRNAKVVLTWKK